jgi:hypothetical protein
MTETARLSIPPISILSRVVLVLLVISALIRIYFYATAP